MENHQVWFDLGLTSEHDASRLVNDADSIRDEAGEEGSGSDAEAAKEDGNVELLRDDLALGLGHPRLSTRPNNWLVKSLCRRSH